MIGVFKPLLASSPHRVGRVRGRVMVGGRVMVRGHGQGHGQEKDQG